MSDFALDLDVMDPYEVAYDGTGYEADGYEPTDEELRVWISRVPERVWDGEDE